MMGLLQVVFHRQLDLYAFRCIELCEVFLDKTLRVAGPVLIFFAAALIT